MLETVTISPSTVPQAKAHLSQLPSTTALLIEHEMAHVTVRAHGG
jgi:hypothetical protein